MDQGSKSEYGNCYSPGIGQEFTPITVSANFAALRWPNGQTNQAVSFQESDKSERKSA